MKRQPIIAMLTLGIILMSCANWETSQILKGFPSDSEEEAIRLSNLTYNDPRKQNFRGFIRGEYTRLLFELRDDNRFEEEIRHYLKHLSHVRFRRANVKLQDEYSYKCLDYLPGGDSVFSKNCLSGIQVYNRMPTYSRKKRLQKWKIIEFNQKSSHFDFEFSFPEDYHVDIVRKKSNFVQTHIIEEESYLVNCVLALPPRVPVKHFTYSESIDPRYGLMNLKEPSEFDGLLAFIDLIPDTLQLNPAFVQSYEESIKIIWELYLFNINYNILDDTIRCVLGSIHTASSKDVLKRYDSYELTYSGCVSDVYQEAVFDYLESLDDQDLEIYESYFELILWQLFQPTNFKMIDKNGKRKSLVFTSRDLVHVGKYEVKFDPIQPFNFKVSKL